MKSIFVSSTFRDMNFERDILNKSIAPKLNYYLSEHNQALRVLDLRWGVDTSDMNEQEASERVLRVCFDQLENCKPYIIILLGDRYGYIPENSDVSITHMEILKGVIENAEKDHVFIYMRNADYSGMPDELKQVYIEQNEDAKNKLEGLKDELKRLVPERCFDYSSHWDNGRLISEEFENSVLENLRKEFVESYASASFKSPLQKQFLENEEILKDNLKYAYNNESEMPMIVATAKDGEMPLGFIGNGGSGKSVFLSLLCSALRKDGQKVNILFCGDNQFSSYVRNAAEYVVYTMATAAGLEYDFEKFAKLEYNDLLGEALKIKDLVKQKVYVILDAVDKCDKGMVDFILWCYRFLSNEVRIIFSSRDSEELIKADKSLDTLQIRYDKTDLGYIAEGILAQHGKSINKNLIELLCNKAESPLHLKVMLTRLLDLNAEDFSAIQTLGGGMDAINEHLKDLIEKMPEDTPNAIENYLISVSDDERATGFFAFLLNLISYSPYGLHENDLQKIFAAIEQPWIEMDYIDFLSKYSLFIRTRDNGRIDISHDIIRWTFCELFSENKNMICSMMAQYFLAKNEVDAYSIRSFFDVAFLGGCQRLLLEFLIKYLHTFKSFDPQNQLISDETQRCLSRLFLLDGGDFVFGATAHAKTPEELLRFHAALSSSLLSFNDYLSEDEVLLLLKGIMGIPVMYDFFPVSMMSLELESCRQFAKRHNANNENIDNFFATCEEALSKRTNVEGAELNSTLKSENLNDMLDFLNNSSENITDKIVVLTKLLRKIKELSMKTETAKEVAEIALKTVETLKNVNFNFDKENELSTFAAIYSYLGEAYKTLNQFEDALKYDNMSLKLYEDQYNLTPSDAVFRKYRERVFNVANITEKQAITTDDKALWEQTRNLYEKNYGLDLLAIASGIPENELIQCAFATFSFGTALVKTGDSEKGVEKYREGIKLITELPESEKRPDLLYELIVNIFDSIYVLLHEGEFVKASDFTKELLPHISSVIKANSKEHNNKLIETSTGFFNGLNQLLTSLFNNHNIDGGISLSKILFDIYNALFDISPMSFKANLILMGKNVGDLSYLYKGDYETAHKYYIDLLNTVSDKKLSITTPDGRFDDNVNIRLIDILARIVICLYRLERFDEVKLIIDKFPAWAKFISENSEVAKGDAPRVLYTLATELARNGVKFSTAVMMMAFSATRADDYDSAAHAETIQLIMNSLFGQGNSTPNNQ